MDENKLSVSLRKSPLIVVDVQKGFDDPFWGERNNESCEDNIVALIADWKRRRWPIIFVRHDSLKSDSPIYPESPGNALKEIIAHERPDLLITKCVNSAFYGDPDLHKWLANQEIDSLVICGITTNHCCETTARMGGNLGYEVYFALDATHTFDRLDLDGDVIPADEVARMTAANLNGEFATVVATRDLLRSPIPGE